MKSLNFFTAFLIRSAFGVIESQFINQITNLQVQRAMKLSLKPLRNTIDALSDGNPANDEQVKAIWDGFVSTDLPDFAEAELTVLVDKIKNENTKAVLGTLSDPFVDIFRLLTDANKDNEAQVNARLQELISDPKSLEVLVRNVAIPIAEKIKNDEVRKFLIAYLQSILEGGIGIEG